MRRSLKARYKSADGKQPASIHVRRWRLWLFRGVTLFLTPVLVLLLLESGLRVGGYGFPTGVTVPCEVDGVVCRGDNVRFGWRFFPPNIAQEFDPFVFPAAKPEGVYRIFVLGASAAQGTPDPAYSFGRLLEVILDEAHSGTDFEVTVAAMPAINSHVAVELAKDLAKYEPDLFITYLGNNEVVGPYGPGTVFAPLSPNLALIRAGIRLKATRTGQLLVDLASRIGFDSGAPKVWRGLEMFVSRRVAADDRRLETTYRHFRRNLEAIRRAATGRGSGIIFCTVGSNLRDCPPFASTHQTDLDETDAARWTQLYERGTQYEAGGDYTAAVESYLAAAGIDDRYADLQFRLGRCYWRMEEHEAARDRFMLARDLDALRFRPDRHINQTIREVADAPQERRIHLIDAEEIFRAHSPFGVPGRELFHEHVHLSFRGNYLLARAVAEQVGHMLAPETGRPLLDEAKCAERLGYNAWAHYNTLFKVLHYYLRKPPFTSQLDHDARVARLAQELRQMETSLTADVHEQIATRYRDLIERSPGDIWLRLRFAEFSSVRLNDERTAIGQCRRVQKLVPHSYKPHLLLGLSLGRLNRFEEAIEHLHQAVQRKPTCGQAHHLLGLAYQAQGRTAEAMRCYTSAVRLRPDNAEAYGRMHDILVSQGKITEARRLLREAALAADGLNGEGSPRPQTSVP